MNLSSQLPLFLVLVLPLGGLPGKDVAEADPGLSLAEHRKSLPPKPVELAVEATAEGVLLSWEVLIECPVYLIYRTTGARPPKEEEVMPLIGASMETEFLDRDPPEGPAYYAVVSMNAFSSQSPRSRLVGF